MPAMPIEIELMLNEINEHLLSYFLRQYMPSSEQTQPNPLAAEARRIARTSGIERRIQEGMSGLFEEDAKGSSISSRHVYDILYHASDAADIEGNPGQGLKALKALKEKIVGFSQGVIMQKVGSSLSVVPATYIAMMEYPEVRAAFLSNADGRHCTDHSIEDFVSLLASGPNYAEEYMRKVRSAFDKNDIVTAVLMIQALEENLVSVSLRPTGFNDDSAGMKNIERTFGPVRYSYAKMLFQLEEMQIRLSNLKRSWPGIIEQVFRSDLTDDLSVERDELEMLRAKMMRPDLQINVDKKGFGSRPKDSQPGFDDIITRTALKGDLHMSMAQRFVEECIRDINRDVFSIGAPTVRQKEGTRDIIVIEPRAFQGIESEKTRVYGFTHEEISSFGEKAYGIVSTYLKIPLPLKKIGPEEKVAASAEQHRGRLFYAEKTVVIDLYGDRCSPPSALVYSIGKPCLEGLLAGTPIPSEGLQVVMKYDVHLLDDLTIAAQAPIKRTAPDGKKVIDYKVYRKDGSLGEHAKITDQVEDNPESMLMPRAEFDKWKRGK